MPSAPRLTTFASFVLRVCALIALLAVPILGTTYSLVSSVSADIAMATTEHTDLHAFARVVELVPALEAFHRDLERGDPIAGRRDRIRLATATRAAEAAYAAGRLPAARAVWQRWHRQWLRIDQRPTPATIDAALDSLKDISVEIENDSPLDFDPNFAVQDLASGVLRQIPRSIVALRRTADASGDVRDARLDVRSIEHIASAAAVQSEPIGRVLSELPSATNLEPSLAPVLDPLIERVRRTTAAFNSDIGGILRSLRERPVDRLATERSAQRAIDAQIALWRGSIDAADGLTVAHRDAQLQRRRIIIALAVLAVLLGALGLTVSIRQMARRDRLELAAAKLESDKLRAELRQVSTERALRLQEAQFRSVFENAEFGIVIFDRDGTVAQSNAAVSAMLGERHQLVLGDRKAEISSIATSRESLTLEELHARADGGAQWLALTFSGVYDDGDCQMVILLVRDTTEEKLLQQQLVFAAKHDGLTQIANRMAFEDELQAIVSERTEPAALMFIDLDSFKPVNDTFGHAAGDQVLITTAERLRSALSVRDFCGRLGGDEFAAIVRGVADPAILESIGARICATIAAPISFGGETFAVTASVGIAMRRREHRSAAELKLEADRALYVVKGRGGNGYLMATSVAPVAALPA